MSPWHFEWFPVILLHPISLNKTKYSLSGCEDHCGDPRIVKIGVEGSGVTLFFLYRHKFCLQKLLNYHNNLAAVVFIHSHCCTEVHQTLFQSWFAYYDASTAHHPFSSLNIRYLAFFSSVFRKKNRKKKSWFSRFNSPQRACNWCLRDWLLLRSLLSHKSLSIQSRPSMLSSEQKQITPQNTTVNIP